MNQTSQFSLLQDTDLKKNDAERSQKQEYMGT